MSDNEWKITERKKEALKKDFYNRGQQILKAVGKHIDHAHDVFESGSLKIQRFHWDQQWTGGGDDIEIFSDGKSVYLGAGNEYAGPGEDGIRRYVPGAWEDEFNRVAERANIPSFKRSRDLHKDWGL